MTNFRDVLKKDLTVFTSRIDAWETSFEEDPKANRKVQESDEECFVNEKRAVECLDCEAGPEKRDKNITHGGDTQGAPRNKRRCLVPSTKDTTLHQVRKEIATLGQRIEILNWYHANGRNQTQTAKHFDTIYPNLKIKQPLVSSWVKDELKWREEWECNHGSGHTAKRIRRIPFKSLSSPSVSVSSSPTLNGPTNPIVETDNSDDLVATGAHQTIKPITTDVLILPEEAPENETSHTVMDSQEVHEHGTEDVGSINFDVDTPRDSTRQSRPTPKEALQAALVLKRYLAAIDDPFARKMEANLDLFINQIHLIEARRNLKSTRLTHYFPRK